MAQTRHARIGTGGRHRRTNTSLVHVYGADTSEHAIFHTDGADTETKRTRRNEHSTVRTTSAHLVQNRPLFLPGLLFGLVSALHRFAPLPAGVRGHGRNFPPQCHTPGEQLQGDRAGRGAHRPRRGRRGRGGEGPRSRLALLTLLEPQSRFGDELLGI